MITMSERRSLPRNRDDMGVGRHSGNIYYILNIREYNMASLLVYW